MNRHIYWVAVLFFLFSCGGETENEKKVTRELKKKLTIILVDISGSFNKPILDKDSPFNGQNYFELSCSHIVENYIMKSDTGSCLIVKRISDKSFGEKNYVATFDFSDTTLLFLETQPENPLQVRDWENRKKAKEGKASQEIASRKEKAKTNILSFQEEYKKKPSMHTDIDGALHSCLGDFNNKEYKDYQKQLIIYSDLLHEPPINKANTDTLFFKNIEVLVKFVSKVGHEPQQYQKLINSWKEKLYQSKSFSTQTVEQSLKSIE